MTTEPPKGVKANMKHLYQLVSEARFDRCSRPVIYRKLFFSLCIFHSILLERKKFLQMGRNTAYSFSDSDFEVSESLLNLYLSEYEEIPWDALKYLIAGVNYGGHVTDDWDRRLLTTYINDYFCDAAVNENFLNPSLLELERGIKGLVVMSPIMEETFNCIYDARVPPLWEKAYPSLKPLAAWTRDLCQRVDQFARWAETTEPPNLFWLSGFTSPNGFLTAALQSYARKYNISVDMLSWEFIVSTVDDIHLSHPPKRRSGEHG